MSATGTSTQPIEVLYGDHHGWLRGWLRKRLGNAFDAADLAHDTYVRILASGTTPPHQSRRYLTQIANGLLIDLYRRRGIEAAYLEAIAALPEVLAPSEETRALALEALVEIDTILHKLPRKARMALLLCKLDGLSYREIAERLHVSVSSVEKYVSAALLACYQALYDGTADALGQVAGQGPIDPAIVRRASAWMARLWSGEASAADRAACDAWLAAHPDHQRAWTRLQVMEGKLGGVSEPAARQVLLEARPAVAVGRRKALQVLGLAAVAVGTACALRESGGWYALTADYRSGVGEIREITLADGTRVVLDSHSAIDVRFDGRERRILLREGEILVTTAVDPLARPLRVQSRQGWVQALGTRFTLRDEGRLALLAVYEGAVDVYPGDATAAALQVHSGQRVRFDARHAEGPMAAREADAAWARGVLVAEDLRVADFTAQLGRYRSGFLRCDPAVADLRVTGVFSLQDTDRALRNLALGLPVDIRYRSPYWVTVSARTAR